MVVHPIERITYWMNCKQGVSQNRGEENMRKLSAVLDATLGVEATVAVISGCFNNFFFRILNCRISRFPEILMCSWETWMCCVTRIVYVICKFDKCDKFRSIFLIARVSWQICGVIQEEFWKKPVKRLEIHVVSCCSYNLSITSL